MRIGVVLVPYISGDKHLEMALETIDTLKTTEHELYFYVIANKVRAIEDAQKLINALATKSKNVYYVNNDRNCLSKAWNFGIERALEHKCDYVFLPNLDLHFKPDCLDRLIQGVKETPDGIFWCATNYPRIEEVETAVANHTITEDLDGNSFSYFVVTQKLIDEVGFFDEQFEPAYFEDNDMYYRITLVGGKFYRIHDALVYHYGSGTLANDVQLRMQNNQTFIDNQNRYKAKWGGLPHQEAYKHPFNDKNKSLKEVQKD